jgi:hypothetical protein
MRVLGRGAAIAAYRLSLPGGRAQQPVVKASFRTVMWTTVELAMSWRAIDEARRTDRP